MIFFSTTESYISSLSALKTFMNRVMLDALLCRYQLFVTFYFARKMTEIIETNFHLYRDILQHHERRVEFLNSKKVKKCGCCRLLGRDTIKFKLY